jgi:hypothetical protein
MQGESLDQIRLPEAGTQLTLRGLSEADAAERLQQEGFTSYIRSFICCQVLTGHIGVKVKPGAIIGPTVAKLRLGRCLHSWL